MVFIRNKPLVNGLGVSSYTSTMTPHPQDADGDVQVLQQQPEDVDGAEWGGVEENIEDPEEVRVIFCALDSFL